MPDFSVYDLYLQYMNDATFTPLPGKTKHTTAWEIAANRHRQSTNNDRALEMANDREVIDEDDLDEGPMDIKKQANQHTPSPEAHYCPKHGKFETGDIHKQMPGSASHFGQEWNPQTRRWHKKKNTLTSITKDDIDNIIEEISKAYKMQKNKPKHNPY